MEKYTDQSAYNSTLAERIRTVSDKKHLTLTQIADEAGIARQQLSSYANGSKEPKGSTVAKIAKAMNVSSDYLLGLSDDDSPIVNSKNDFTTYYDVAEALDKIIAMFAGMIEISEEEIMRPDFESDIEQRLLITIKNDILISYYARIKQLHETMSKYQDDPIVLDALKQSSAKALDDLKQKFIW